MTSETTTRPRGTAGRATAGQAPSAMSSSPVIIEGLEALRAGRAVLLIDTAVSVPEGHLLLAASTATPASVAFMVRHSSGVLCVALDGEACDRMGLPPMVRHNENQVQAGFTVSVDAISGTSTGISAADRATTITLLAGSGTQPDELSRPGHVFPLRARRGGVLERPRYTEAAVELTAAAGLGRAGVIAAVVNDDSSDITHQHLRSFAVRHQIPVVTINEIVDWIRTTDPHDQSPAEQPPDFSIR